MNRRELLLCGSTAIIAASNMTGIRPAMTKNLNNNLSDNKNSGTWEYLRPGDKIAVIAPSSPPSNPLETFNQIEAYFSQSEYEIVIPKDLLAPTKPLNEANTIEGRVRFIQEALNSDARAIWAVMGGGWGVELLPSLMKMDKPQSVKPVIGYSDVSALHVFFNSVWNWPSLHSIVLGANGNINSGESWNKTAIMETLNVLSGRETSLSYEISAINHSAKETGEIKNSYVSGGNSLIISALNGTKYFQPKSRNGILFIESVAINPGIFSRIINGFKYSDISQQAKAIIFGTILETGGKENPLPIEDQYAFLLNRFGEDMDKLSIPVFKANHSFGHGPENFPLPLNTLASIVFDPKPSLKVSAR